MNDSDPYAEAAALLESGAVGRAIEVAEAGLRDAPERADLRNLHGVALLSAGRLRDGVEALRKAAALAPSDPEPLRNLLKVYAVVSAWDQADVVADALLRLTPLDTEVLSLAARAKLGLGLHAAAEAHMRRVTLLAPTAVDAWIELIELLNRQGRPADAIAACEAAVAANPSEPKLAERRRELASAAPLPGGA